MSIESKGMYAEVKDPSIDIEGAISYLKLAQECVSPVLEVAPMLANQNFHRHMKLALDAINACAEELEQIRIMSEFMKDA
jgi:hypothetical protein